jgi:hypothetical protein
VTRKHHHGYCNNADGTDGGNGCPSHAASGLSPLRETQLVSPATSASVKRLRQDERDQTQLAAQLLICGPVAEHYQGYYWSPSRRIRSLPWAQTFSGGDRD